MSSLEAILARALEGKGISLVPRSDDGRGTGLEDSSTALVPWKVFSLDRPVVATDAAKQLPLAPVTASLPFGSKSDGVTVAKCRCSRILTSSKKEGTFEWKFKCRTSKTLHISVYIEKSMMAPPHLRVVLNGLCVFPKGWNGDTNSIRKPGKLSKDFAESWSMSGAVRGLRMERAIEMRFRSGHGLFSAGKEDWLIGTLVGQSPRSEFDVLVEIRDCDGVFREKLHSQVPKSELRYADTKEPLQAYEHKISLFVPQNNTLEDATFTIDGEKTFVLARQSPAHNAEEPPHIIIQVPKHSKTVTANASLATLSNHSSRQVRAITSSYTTSGFGSRSWVFQIGHAQHRISVSRQSKTRDVTLEVDGDVLVEGSPDEVGCYGDTWEISFRFFGERCLDFYLLHTNTVGHHVAEPHIVTQRNSFSHACTVSIKDVSAICRAGLCIDGFNFGSLPHFEEDHSQPNVHINLSLLALTSECNMVVPLVVSQFPTLIACDDAVSEPGTILSAKTSLAGVSNVGTILTKRPSVNGNSETGASKRTLFTDLSRISEAGSNLSMRSPRGVVEMRSDGSPSYAEQFLMQMFSCSDPNARPELGGFESLLTFGRRFGRTPSVQDDPGMQDVPGTEAIEEGRFVREGIGLSRRLEVNASLTEPKGTPLATNVAEYLQGKYEHLAFDYENLSVDV